MKTLKDLASFVRSQSIRDSRNYDPDGWRSETNFIRRQRRWVYNDFGARWRQGTEELKPGRYGRLRIASDGSPDFIPGQYAPTEIWYWIHVYLEQTN